MHNVKHTFAHVASRAVMALFLAVMLCLPNYSRAIEADREYNDYLTALYDAALVDLGAQEAHAVVPALAIPAALTAAGVTTETLAAAFAAIGTAVAGISIIQTWDDLSQFDKLQWNSKEDWIAAQLLGMGLLQGWLTPGEPSGGDEQPPEFNGDNGERWKNILIKLAAGGVGTIALAELGLQAKDIIDYFCSPAGTDANGYPTGLGITGSSTALIGNYSYNFTSAYQYPSTISSLDSWTAQNYSLATSFNWYLSWVDSNGVLYYQWMDDNSFLNSSLFPLRIYLSDSGQIMSQAGWLTNFSQRYYFSSDKYYRTAGSNTLIVGATNYLNPAIDYQFLDSNSNVIASYIDGVWSGDVTVTTLNYPALNVPSFLSGLLSQVAQAGVGTPEADQIINDYVTNNISNSTQYVTVPSTLEDTADYDKVVTDTAPTPDPDPDPDPDPTDESPADKAKKFLKLPVEQLFPFCLVYDIQLAIEHIAGGVPMYEDGSLVFSFNVGFGYFDAPLVIDLTDYSDLQGPFHAAFDIFLVIGLLYFSISLFLKARGDQS